MANEKTLLQHLEEAVAEEQSDSEKYLAMAEKAMQEYPHTGYACILRDIAREETVHHRHLQTIISDMHEHSKMNEVQNV